MVTNTTMADISRKTDGPPPSDQSTHHVSALPDYDRNFLEEEDVEAFVAALNVSETSPSQENLPAPSSKGTFVTALNDWRPVRQRVKKRRKPSRGRDETREGYLYALLKWPFLLTVLGWISFLGISYFCTRVYILLYEHLITWRGRREHLRRALRKQNTYQDWVNAATKLDAHLNNHRWKTTDDNAYYDSRTIKRVRNQMRKYRQEVENQESSRGRKTSAAVVELRALVEASVRDNFAGFESPRLYSETYYGCKSLQQSFIDEAEVCLSLLKDTSQLDNPTKRIMFKHLQTNFGRTALCLSGGATFAYYHFGVAKALLDAQLLPQVITGTSGGALVAALLATRTDDELKSLLVPALAHRITACNDGMFTWLKRWWKTGARFDPVDWARQCSWFTRGSITFKEAYERTGRILNISCVPSDPHSPAILANYLTSPDCVIWSAVLASAAVPGILPPIVLMKKNSRGKLEPYSFGHKWKDGSLRTDIPLRALNLHFNVNFTIVSQVNPHINLFFFSSRGTVGRPVTHRRGRGWRGGFLGSATEQYLKLDLTKWLKVLRDLELLPRPMGQDWSQLWLQRFSGTITIWPKSVPSDFINILSDPTPKRLARMIHTGQLSAWPKLLFIANRMKLEKIIEQGRRSARPRPDLWTGFSIEDLDTLPDRVSRSTIRRRFESAKIKGSTDSSTDEDDRNLPGLPFNPAKPGRTVQAMEQATKQATKQETPTVYSGLPKSSSFSSRVRSWFSPGNQDFNQDFNPESHTSPFRHHAPASESSLWPRQGHTRSGSMLLEMARQSQVFLDDDDFEGDSGAEGRRRNNEYYLTSESDDRPLNRNEMDHDTDCEDDYDEDDDEQLEKMQLELNVVN